MKTSTFGAILVGVFLAGLLAAIVFIAAPGYYIHAPETVPAPKATPMDVILRMRDADGKNEQEWVCKFEAEQGWVCQPRKEPSDGATLDQD